MNRVARARCVVSAKDAFSFLAWGNAPGLLPHNMRALKARFKSLHWLGAMTRAFRGNDVPSQVFLERYPTLEMNRARAAAFKVTHTAGQPPFIR
jgi:hypothetical protein